MKLTLSWMFYYLGDGVSRIMNLADRLGVLYPLYNWLMMKSVKLQGDDPNGPWEPC